MSVNGKTLTTKVHVDGMPTKIVDFIVGPDSITAQSVHKAAPEASVNGKTDKTGPEPQNSNCLASLEERS